MRITLAWDMLWGLLAPVDGFLYGVVKLLYILVCFVSITVIMKAGRYWVNQCS